MDLITVAIISAIAKLSDTVIQDAYEALKAVIVRKYGLESDVVDSIKKLEDKPESAGRRETLSEEIIDSNAGKDPDILRAFQDLQALLQNQHNSGGQVNIQVSGGTVQGIVGAGQAQVGTISFEDNTRDSWQQ